MCEKIKFVQINYGTYINRNNVTRIIQSLSGPYVGQVYVVTSDNQMSYSMFDVEETIKLLTEETIDEEMKNKLDALFGRSAYGHNRT